MSLVLLKAGRILSYMQHVSFYLELSVLLFSIGAAVWFVHSVKKHTSTKLIATPSMKNLAAIVKAKATEISKPVGFLVVGLVIGAIVGYLWRDHEFRVNYAKDYSSWQQRSVSYQKAYAAWAARQPQEK